MGRRVLADDDGPFRCGHEPVGHAVEVHPEAAVEPQLDDHRAWPGRTGPPTDDHEAPANERERPVSSHAPGVTEAEESASTGRAGRRQAGSASRAGAAIRSLWRERYPASTSLASPTEEAPARRSSLVRRS